MLPVPDTLMFDVRRALDEDIRTGDVTAALLPEDQWVDGVIISREPMVICGRPWVDAVFSSIDASIEVQWLVDEGAWLDKPSTLCRIHGKARSILTAERTALNFMQTLSATATQTREYVQALQGYKTRLLDTRKTLPGLRLAQKYAVSCAGGVNHRLGLHDAFLIKENHIAACGSIREAIARARSENLHLLVEVEVENLEQLQEALEAKPDRIMLDNFTLPLLHSAVAMTQSRCELEASGGIDLSSLAQVAQTGVDYVSVGAITKSIRAIDLSLLLQGAS